MNEGRVAQVIGPVIDVEFEGGHIPEIYTALVIDEKVDGREIKLTAEVEQQIGRNQVKAVAMSSTDGVVRGMKVVDTGRPISGPVEDIATAFTWFRPICCSTSAVTADTPRRQIHHEPPIFDALEPKTEIFETGIKV